jgi:hypothetical protein
MKSRRLFIKKISIGAIMASLATLPLRASAKKDILKGLLVHHVFFWLKEPANVAVRQQFEKAIGELMKVGTIKLAHLGKPASTEQRDVVDHSYTYSFLIFFDSKEDQDSYQVDPLHEKFIDENKHLWEKVVVYDSIDL